MFYQVSIYEFQKREGKESEMGQIIWQSENDWNIFKLLLLMKNAMVWLWLDKIYMLEP